MTPSEQCKAAGLSSLAELVRITGVGERTLINWHKNKTKLFETVIAGAMQLRDEPLKINKIDQKKAIFAAQSVYGERRMSRIDARNELGVGVREFAQLLRTAVMHAVRSFSSFDNALYLGKYTGKNEAVSKLWDHAKRTDHNREAKLITENNELWGLLLKDYAKQEGVNFPVTLDS